jgi:hypothetical protein
VFYQSDQQHPRGDSFPEAKLRIRRSPRWPPPAELRLWPPQRRRSKAEPRERGGVELAEHPSKPGKPRKDMPFGFAIKIKSAKEKDDPKAKKKGRSPWTTVYFDPKTEASRDNWMQFLKDGPRFDDELHGMSTHGQTHAQ